MLKENKKQESGRSMIEMLGVLAIIGVLSVGGIYGYTTAMRSHKANEIINGASMLYMMGIAQNGGSGDAQMLYSTHFGSNAVPDGASEITYNTDKSMTLAITDVNICYQVKNKLGDKVTNADCSTSPYSLTVAFGEVASPDGKPCSSDSECGTGYGCSDWEKCAPKPSCYTSGQSRYFSDIPCCTGLLEFPPNSEHTDTSWCSECISVGETIPDEAHGMGICCDGLEEKAGKCEEITCVQEGEETTDPSACCPGTKFEEEMGICIPWV